MTTRLKDIWERRWAGSEESEKLTILGRLMFRAKLKALRSLVPQLHFQTVIEVGCGLGHTLQFFHEQGADAQGIDISPTAIQVCQAKGLKASLRSVEDEKDRYDLVSSDGMLEHFINFEPMARELMRISLHHVLLIQPNHGSLLGRTLPFLSETLRGDANVLEYNYRIADFVAVFEANGFSLMHSVPVFSDVFRILVFNRDDGK